MLNRPGKYLFNMPFKAIHFFRNLLIISILADFFGGCQDDPIDVNNGSSGSITAKTGAFINTIQISSFPATDPMGMTWDDTNSAALDTFGLADIFFNISPQNDPGTVLWSQGTHFNNRAATDTTTYYLVHQYEVIPFGSTIDVNVYDYELPDSTWMGKVSFLIDQYPNPDNPYPSYVTGFENGYTVTIGITWVE